MRSKYDPAEAERYVVKTTNPVFRAAEGDMEAGTYITATANANGLDFAESGDVRWDNICN